MTLRRVATVLVALIAAAAFGWLVMTALGRVLRTPAEPPEDPAPVEEAVTPAPAPPAAGPRIKATLFYASEDGQRLVGVPQDVPLAEGTVAQARALVEALLLMPPPAPLAATIPAGTTVRGVYASERGELFVDLDATLRTKHPGGSMQELLTVYSIVNTLLVNLPTSTDVQILIDGQEADTLAGHVDLRRPLRKNEGLVLAADSTPSNPLP